MDRSTIELYKSNDSIEPSVQLMENSKTQSLPSAGSLRSLIVRRCWGGQMANGYGSSSTTGIRRWMSHRRHYEQAAARV